jgi:hypothetical protein
MTEAEWLACVEPRLMLDHLRSEARDRGLWLFVAAVCRRGSSFFPDEINRTFVAIAEALAEQTASPEDVLAARQAAGRWKERFVAEQDFERAALMRDLQDVLRGGPPRALRAARWAQALPDNLSTLWRGWEDARRGPPWPADPQCTADGPGHRLFQAALLRDLFNPFGRPSHIDPVWSAWHDGLLPKLAQTIHEERAFDRLPILADALEDAGCADRALLDHLRGPAPHVRGCWALGLILDKR